MKQRKHSYVIVKTNDFNIDGCPSFLRTYYEVGQYQNFVNILNSLTTGAKQHNSNIIADEFDDWAVIWGSSKTNGRGRILCEVICCQKITLANYILSWILLS